MNSIYSYSYISLSQYFMPTQMSHCIYMIHDKVVYSACMYSCMVVSLSTNYDVESVLPSQT